MSDSKRTQVALEAYYWGDVFGYRDGMRRSVLSPLAPHIANRIPQEIFDHIIDQLAGQASDLVSCALVCRSWNYRSTALLCTRVELNCARHFDNLANAALREQRVRRYLAGTRHLSIKDRADEPRSHRAVYIFPSVMRTLDSLVFSRCTWAPIHPSFLLLLPQFATVTRVKLHTVKLQNFSDFRRVICAFPRLGQLTIEQCSLKHYNPIHLSHAPSTAPVLAHLCRLKLLRNDVQLLANLTQWFRILGRVDALRELALTESLRDTGFDLDALDHILRSVGSQLKSLSINYPWINGMSRTLQHTPWLQNLTFPIPALSMRLNPLDLVDELKAVVTSLPSTRLQSLTMSETMGSISREGARQRRHTAEEIIQGGDSTIVAIDDEQFQALQNVTVVLCPMNHRTDDHMVQVIEMIRHMFSPWDIRGILNVS